MALEEEPLPDVCTEDEMLEAFEHRRAIYRAACQMIQPNDAGLRVLQDKRRGETAYQLFLQLVQEICPTTVVTKETLAGPQDWSYVVMKSGRMFSVYNYASDVSQRAIAAGWIAIKVVKPGQGQSWIWQTCFVADPDQLDEMVDVVRAELPAPRSRPVYALELERAFGRLMADSLELNGERFVAHPDRALTKAFGSEYDTAAAVDQLIDAGLAEWRQVSKHGSESDRLFLKEPEMVPVAAPTDAIVELAERLRSQRQAHVANQAALVTAEQGLRGEIEQLEARVRQLSSEADQQRARQAELGVRIAAIDAQLQELDEIGRREAELRQAEAELAERKARALQVISS